MSTVLVVEDDANVRKLVVVNLLGRGYTVLEAPHIQQALTQLQTMAPDLMILDIKLPDGTGWDLLARLADDPAPGLRFPVLVMTASIMESHVDRQRFPDVVDVLIKPFSAAKLMKTIERALHSLDSGEATSAQTWSDGGQFVPRS